MNKSDDDSLTIATLLDMVLGEDAENRSNDALIRTVGSLIKDESSFRVKNACDQLLRYGNPHSNVIIDVLETLADINDDLCNDRHQQHIIDGIEKAKNQLSSIID